MNIWLFLIFGCYDEHSYSLVSVNMYKYMLSIHRNEIEIAEVIGYEYIHLWLILPKSFPMWLHQFTFKGALLDSSSSSTYLLTLYIVIGFNLSNCGIYIVVTNYCFVFISWFIILSIFYVWFLSFVDVLYLPFGCPLVLKD